MIYRSRWRTRLVVDRLKVPRRTSAVELVLSLVALLVAGLVVLYWLF